LELFVINADGQKKSEHDSNVAPMKL